MALPCYDLGVVSVFSGADKRGGTDCSMRKSTLKQSSFTSSLELGIALVLFLCSKFCFLPMLYLLLWFFSLFSFNLRGKFS
jgi:hypothetical protein